MLKLVSAAVLAAFWSAALAQTQPGQTTPTITPSQTPSNASSQTPAVTPSQTPSVTPPGDAPVVGGPAPTVGGIESRPLGALSQCDNLIGLQKEQCLQAESAARGGTAPGTAPR
jgi:hypothetical protein